MQILEDAVMKSEMDLLLLGKHPYTYLPRRSPSTGSTDLAELLRVAYECWPVGDRNRLVASLTDAINKLVSSYDGLVPVATCLLIEILRQSKNRNPLGLPVSYITRRLKDSIDEFRVRLSSDFSGYGAQWQDGLLGELRHLSGLVRRRGGIEFVTLAD